MRIDELTVGPVQTRCYVLSKEDGQECIVIDPGDEAKRIRKAAGDRKIAAILLTHGHFDHIGAVRELLNSEFRIQNSELSAEAGKDDLSTCRIRKKRPDSSGKEESPMDHVLYAVGDDNASVKTEYDREKR